MDRLKFYLNEYAESHQNKTNILIHKFCVPVIMFSVIGIFKALPVPATWPMWLDWSYILIALALMFYASLKSLKVFLGMVCMVAPFVFILEALRPRFFLLCLFLFIVAWIFQFVGHKIEGKKPSFFKDLLFLLIGPIWVLNFFYRTLISFKKSSAR